MKRLLSLFILALSFAHSASHAQGLNAFIGPFDAGFTSEHEIEAPPNVERVNRVEADYKNKDFVISRFDDRIIEKFREAWKATANGVMTRESVVVILRMLDGTFSARSMGITNEYKSFTFAWHPATIAIVHTHPNSSNPKPLHPDREVADKLGVLMFTITSRGMYLYDPTTKQTTRIQDGLSWMDCSSWAKVKAHLKAQ